MCDFRAKTVLISPDQNVSIVLVNNMYNWNREIFWHKKLCMKTWQSSKSLWIFSFFVVWFFGTKLRWYSQLTYSCRSFQSYLKNMKKLCFSLTAFFENRSFQSHLKKWKCYASRQLSEFFYCGFQNYVKRMKIPCFASNARVDNHSFLSYSKKAKPLCFR